MDDSLRDPPAPIYIAYTYSCRLLFDNDCYFTVTDNYHVKFSICILEANPIYCQCSSFGSACIIGQGSVARTATVILQVTRA
jgi:hypothetical protein